MSVQKRYDARVPTILTDRNQIVQVFVNLVKNAIDAMPGGGQLTVTTALREDRVAVAIRDTGCGMPPEQIERIFMPFFTTKDPGKGTGLGLSVSYTIIRNFGGDFYVESAPGEGQHLHRGAPPGGRISTPHGVRRSAMGKRVKEIMLRLSDYAVVGEDETILDALRALEKSQEKLPPGRQPHRAILVEDARGEIVGKLHHFAFLRALVPERKAMGRRDPGPGRGRRRSQGVVHEDVGPPHGGPGGRL